MKLKNSLLLLIALLLTTFNSYSQWRIVGQLPYAETGTQQPNFIKFYNENIGYASLAGIGPSGWFNVLVKTTDGGVNWSVTSLPTTALTKPPVFMGDAQHFVLAPIPEGTPSYRTVDGGTSFVAMPNLSSSWGNFYFKNALKGFYFLSTYLVAQNMRSTVDGGVTWSTPQPSNPPLSDMYFPNTDPDTIGNIGYVLAGNNFLKTTNDGATWAVATTLSTVPGGNRMAIAFTSPQVWYVGSQFDMYKTSNGGASWSQVATFTNIYKYQFTDTQTGFYLKGSSSSFPIISNTDSVYRTRDGGITWAPFGEFEPFVGSDHISDFSFPGNQVGYAVTYSGIVYKSDNILATEKIHSSKPALYPNPTTDFLSIESDDFNSKSYSIFDLTGRTILNGTISINKIDVSSLANGYYMLKIDDYETAKFKKE